MTDVVIKVTVADFIATLLADVVAMVADVMPLVCRLYCIAMVADVVATYSWFGWLMLLP